jgi:hypothetical protein
MHGGAMEPYNWTEAMQLKWDLRAMMGDAAVPLVNFSSVFTMIDICYHVEGSNVGVYGLLKAPCTGTHPDENKTVERRRSAYLGVQTVMTLWDEDVVAVPDAQFTFNCTRSTKAPNNCAAQQSASTPVFGRHCDYANSTVVGHVAGLPDAAACQNTCCGKKGCTCWTWSPPPAYNQGCWMFNSSVPNLPMPHMTTGWVVRNSSASMPAPFVPMGYAFRNTSTTTSGITHAVVLDATTVLNDDRATQCNVTVSLPPTSSASAGSIPRMGGGISALKVLLTNGTVFEATSIPGSSGAVFPTDPTAPVAFSVDLFDAPTLIVREDAMPPIGAVHE